MSKKHDQHWASVRPYIPETDRDIHGDVKTPDQNADLYKMRKSTNDCSMCVGVY